MELIYHYLGQSGSISGSTHHSGYHLPYGTDFKKVNPRGISWATRILGNSGAVYHPHVQEAGERTANLSDSISHKIALMATNR